MFSVLIDSSSFEAEGLSFNNAAFESLELLVDMGRIRLFRSKIIVSECTSHLQASVTRSINLLKKAYSKFDNKTRENFGELSELLGDLRTIKPKILAERLGIMNDFFANPKFVELDIKTVNIEQVFADYFNQAPPFGEGNKKAEFPDAFVLWSFLLANENDLPNAILVSQDEDWKKFSDLHPPIRLFTSIGEFIDFVNTTYPSLLMEMVRRAYGIKAADLTKHIYKKIADNDDFDLPGAEWTDPEVEVDPKSVKIGITSSNLLKLEEGSADWEIILNISYIVFVWDVDGDSWIKDDDTKEIIYRRNGEFTIGVTKQLELEIKTYFDPESIADSFEFETVDLPEDLFYIDVHGDDARIIQAKYDDESDYYEQE